MPDKTLNDQIRDILRLDDPVHSTRNILAILGLQGMDFGSPVRTIWDAEEITVEAKPIPPVCTCTSLPKDPKVRRVAGEFHASRCNLAMWDALGRHPWLVDLDGDDDQNLYTFQWPRDISRVRATLAVAFPHLEVDAAWEIFQTDWGKVTRQMPEPRPSLAEHLEPEPTPEPEESSTDFSDLDFDAPPVPPLSPFAEPVKGSERIVAFNKATKVVEEVKPVVPAPANGKHPGGRPKGSGKLKQRAAREMAVDIKPKDLVPPEPDTAIPACQKLAHYLNEEFHRLKDILWSLRTATEFDGIVIEEIKTSLDQMALRASHLQHWSAKDEGREGINPMIEVVVLNLGARTKAAIRDLELAPETPEAWAIYTNTLKECKEAAESMHDVMIQPGMGPALQQE